ncbi:MAG: VanZ family protein [Oscillospiraceae bacterium]|nr:VanZ family protein [Oscillospiraceae bacterium]MBP0988703.1 VanZ family protein [Oscillospiraceae bacterium]MBQ5339465.1 VanZ family protein [Oscillospiraceae bacterium]MBR5363823.1 VanZ family protein [Oscillospiraceae bacterium]
MGKIKREKRQLVIRLVLTLLWMCVIFWFSAKNADESSSMSGGLLRSLLSVVIPHWKVRSAAEQQAIIDQLHTIFRKCGHFSEYTVLGILLAAAARQLRKCIAESRQAITKEVIILPALCALLYACSDEFHQRFVAGRSCELRDVCIDFGGAVLGILISTGLSLVLHRIIKNRQKKAAQCKP